MGRFDIIDARAARPAVYCHLESHYRGLVAFRKNLDAAIVLIPHIAANALSSPRILNKDPEPDALNAALDDVTASDEHAGDKIIQVREVREVREVRRVRQRKRALDRHPAPFLSTYFLLSTFNFPLN
ncbi:MAG: hypothetical protein ND807_09485 [Vicinamibacterales bacterium]|nr:hypothetical protein [Vicinamibacterales bacterium]